MTNWIELIEKEIFQAVEFLPPNLLNIIETQFLNDSHLMGGENAEHLTAETYYQYQNVSFNPNKLKDVFIFIKSQLEQKFQELEFPQPFSSANFLLKTFDNESCYHLHLEDKEVFGPYSYVLYLSDEQNSPLIFPGESSVKEDSELAKSFTITKNFQERNKKEPGRFIGPLKIYPEKNKIIVFKTNTFHYVEKSSFFANKRRVLTGWPGADF